MGVITLLTDFGHRDSYVGVMKGVIANISPLSQVVDLTHGIQPQAILAARFNLLTSYGYFPAGTVHVVVVDPGVGTRRNAIAAEVSSPTGLQIIVAPDNGLLTGFSIVAAVGLTKASYWRTPQPSRTFHGRDIFAPVAAHLANGVKLSELGSFLSVKTLVRLTIEDAISTDQGYHGSIQYCDRFGNLVTNIPGHRLDHRPWQMQLAGRSIPYYATYGDAGAGEVLALVGSHGYVEIAVNGGNAAKAFNVQVGERVVLIYARRGLGREGL